MSKLTGVVDENKRPVVRLRVARGRLTFPVWIDLGFDADLVLPISEFARLGVRLTPRRSWVSLADGTMRSMQMGVLELAFLRRTIEARVVPSPDPDPPREVGTGIPLGFIGLGLLERARVTVDLVPQGSVVIERPIPPGKNVK